jgi:hypothetical protein
LTGLKQTGQGSKEATALRHFNKEKQNTQSDCHASKKPKNEKKRRDAKVKNR